MWPILFQWGSIRIFSYGFMIALGILISFAIIQKKGKIHGLTPETIVDVLIYTALTGIVGARLFYVIQFFDLYRDDFWGIFRIWEGGLVLYGGTLFGFVALFFFTVAKKMPFVILTDILVPYFALVQGFGRIGCFLNGCCSGRLTGSSWGVVFPNQELHVHPAQIYSSFFCFVLAAFLFNMSRRSPKLGAVTTCYFLLYAPGRFFLEWFRINPVLAMGLTVAQIISLIVFAIAVFCFVKNQFWKSNETQSIYRAG